MSAHRPLPQTRLLTEPPILAAVDFPAPSQRLRGRAGEWGQTCPVERSEGRCVKNCWKVPFQRRSGGFSGGRSAGAEGRNRTGMSLRTEDFESSASTNSTTSALIQGDRNYIIIRIRRNQPSTANVVDAIEVCGIVPRNGPSTRRHLTYQISPNPASHNRRSE
jgi:hypothetical protein